METETEMVWPIQAHYQLVRAPEVGTTIFVMFKCAQLIITLVFAPVVPKHLVHNPSQQSNNWDHVPSDPE